VEDLSNGAAEVSSAIRDAAMGCLAGVALGDAMGMPSELWTRARVQEHFGWIDQFMPAPEGHVIVDNFTAGQVTDDTEQTAMLIDAIVEGRGEVKRDVVCAHFLKWASTDRATRGNYLGPSSRAAIERLRAGVDFHEAGIGGTTNGAAMRIAPVGIIRSSHDLTSLVDAVYEASVFSHNSDVAMAGAALVAGTISAAISHRGLAHPRPLDPEDFLEVGLAAAELAAIRGEPVYGPSLVVRTRRALDIARESTSDDVFSQRIYDIVGTTSLVAESVPASAALVLRAQGDPMRAAILAANLGGDTDTIGAIATGISGAIGGMEAIPAESLLALDAANPWLQIADRVESLLRFRR
jgi:ADP-ribosylglycohydrolase